MNFTKNTLRIGFFNHSLRLGSGIDVVITELASRLAKTDDVTVYCLKNSYNKREYNFDIKEIRSPFAYNQTSIAAIAPFILDKLGTGRKDFESNDVLNTHIFPANYIVRNLTKPYKIMTEWSVGNPGLWSSSLRQRLYVRWLVYYGNKAAAKKADLLLAPSRFIERWIRQEYKIKAKLFSMDGINFSLLNKQIVSPEKVFQLYPGVEGKKIILFVGRITDHKNIHTLIEAFLVVKKRIKDVVLVLVGDYEHYTSYYEKLVSLVKSKKLVDSVFFTGVVSPEDLPAFYSACSVYATCTLWEGFLRPESFAFEKPIVCFDTGPNSETVVDGERGYLIETNNVESFAERLYQLLIDDGLSQRMGRNGYEWAKQNLDFDVISEHFRKLCKDNLGSNGVSQG